MRLNKIYCDKISKSQDRDMAFHRFKFVSFIFLTIKLSQRKIRLELI